MINVTWGNSVEKLVCVLGKNLDKERAERPSSVLSRSHCVVIPNRILQYWIQHQFLFDNESDDGTRVTANVDFMLLHVFVNDWLHLMSHPHEPRDPLAHPFATASLQWRIYDALGTQSVVERQVFESLRRYIDSAGPGDAQRAHRRFILAGQLARLFDDYQVYRPEMMQAWQEGGNDNAAGEALEWQPELWRHLTSGELESATYLAAFREMADSLQGCGIEDRHPCVHVFGVSIMPRVYTVFFDLLSEVVPTFFYLFNPSKTDWFEAMTPRETESTRHRARLEGIPDEQLLLNADNPLLGSLGRGCRDFLAEIMDITGGQCDDCFTPSREDSLLNRVQATVLENTVPDEPGKVENDTSLQVHVCHSPMREVEILRDHLLRWFDDDSTLQPRHIQVQVSDMALYSPYIDAVFSTHARHAATTIPYSIADRVSVGESVVGEAFSRLLNLSDSRFPVREIMELLECESVCGAFGLDESQMPTVRSLVSGAGIRWGRDAPHRRNELDIDFTEQTSWRHGLDRLLLGYAVTRDTPPRDGLPLACDMVEGEDAEVLGRLVSFFNSLEHTAKIASTPKSVVEWSAHLELLVDNFFATTNNTYRDIHALRSAVEGLRTSGMAADFDGPVPIGVVRDFMAGQLDNAGGGEDLLRNAVVFSALRSGSSAPRRIMCLLGMGDGLFPRNDHRPAYDLFRIKHRRGDPSLQTEDRMAFLEAVMSAGERLYVSYAGRTVKENESIPPATVLSELMEYAESLGAEKEVLCRQHKLQSFHADYFKKGSGLFSYDKAACRAARRILDAATDGETPQAPATAPAKLFEGQVEIDDLARFYNNPARLFYRDVLKAHLDVAETERLEDNEEFMPSGLIGYKVSDSIVTAIREGKTREMAYNALCEDGLVPLEHWGGKWFTERWGEVHEILDYRIADAGALFDLLMETEPLFESPVTVNAGNAMLTGLPTGIHCECEQTIAIDFRCVKHKPSDLLTGWLRHLFACAAGLEETRFCVFARDVKSIKPVCLPPLDRTVAENRLAVLLDIFATGLVAPCPFTPATSHAFVKGWRKTATPEDAGEEQAACVRSEAGTASARKEWYSDARNNTFSDDLNPYYLNAFGPDGPFDDPLFGEVARAVFGPVLDAIEEGGGCHG